MVFFHLSLINSVEMNTEINNSGTKNATEVGQYVK